MPAVLIPSNPFGSAFHFVLKPFFDYRRLSSPEKDFLLSENIQCQNIKELKEKESDFGLDRSAKGLGEFLQNILDSLLCFPLGEQISHSFKNGQWTIALHASDDQLPRLDISEKILSLPNNQMTVAAILRSPYFRNRLVLAFLQGLRRADRLENANWPRLLSPSSFLLAERIKAADANAVMMNLAYGLAGTYPDLWHHAQVMDDGDMIIWSHLDFDLAGSFHEWFRHKGRVGRSDHQALQIMDQKIRDTPDPALYRRGLTLAAIRSYCTVDTRRSYLDDQTGMITLDGLDTIDAAYLAQIERDQHIVMYGSVGVRDRNLADRLFWNVT